MITTQKPYRGMQLNKAHSLARGLVGCWVMNERTGDKVFDLSGNGNHGTNNGADWVADGLDFNGTSDYVDCGNAIGETIESADAFSFIARVKCDNLASDNAVVSRWGTVAAERQFIMWMDTGDGADGWAIATYDGSTYHISGTTVASATQGVYQNVVATFDGSTQKIYVDSIERDSDSGAIQGVSTTNVRIGEEYTGKNFNGIMQYVYIYNRALSAEEVSWLNREPYAMFEQPISPALLYYEVIPSAGFIGKINGISIANIAKVNGVTIENIAKINGIAIS